MRVSLVVNFIAIRLFQISMNATKALYAVLFARTTLAAIPAAVSPDTN